MRTRFLNKEKNSKRLVALLALLTFTTYMPLSCAPVFAIADNTMPDLKSSVNGHVDHTPGSTHMDVVVDQGNGVVGQFDWNSFNVGKNGNVNFQFNGNSQTALNRVLDGKMSEIYGSLTSSSGTGCPSCVNTSKVILINPAGILMGAGSKVNLNSFTMSTFDIKGVKDIDKMTEAEKQAYAGTKGTDINSKANGVLFDIAGYNKTIEYVGNTNMVDGNGMIVAHPDENSKLASIIVDGSTVYANKSIAMVGNKIDIKGKTTLLTTPTSTPNTSGNTQTRSNVKLVTGDGVQFYYTSAGNIDEGKVKVKAGTRTDKQDYGIKINDSQAVTGSFLAYNGLTAENSTVDLKNANIDSRKLLGTTVSHNGKVYDKTETGTSGNIQIYSKGTVNIEDSDIQTLNDADQQSGKIISQDIGYGNMSIEGVKDVTIKNSQVRTADSSKNTDSSNITAGNIKISSSNGNVNIVQDHSTVSDYYTTTGVVSAGDLTITAGKDVNIKGYDRVMASGNSTDKFTSNFNRTATIKGQNVNIDDSLVSANEIRVAADKNINAKDSTLVAWDSMKLYGSDTTIDNSALSYKDLSFYNKDKDKVNNLTVKNGATFHDTDTDDVVISTNGNVTLDNTKLQKRAYTGTGETGLSNAENQKSLTVESTGGNITVKNNSDVKTAQGNLNLKAKGNIAVESNSKLWATNGNNNLTSSEGKITVKNSTVIAEGGDTTLSQALDMDLDKDFNSATVGATNKLTLDTKGNITGSTLTADKMDINSYKNVPTLENKSLNNRFTFGSRMKANAGKSITLSDLKSAKNVDFEAKGNVNLSTSGDMTLTDVTTKSGDNGETKVKAGGNLALNGLGIKGGKKTTLEGKTVKTVDESVIETNGKKLAVNADTDVDITVSGVNNKANGLEINADVNTSQGSDALKGKNVKVKAADGTLTLSKVKADTLDITANKLLKGDTTISAETDNVAGLTEAGVDMKSKGYIEVAKDGGFNLDATTDYNDGNSGIYTGGNYGSTTESSRQKKGGEYSQVTDTQVETTTDSKLVDTKTDKKETGRTETNREKVSEKYSDDRKTVDTTYEVTEDVTYETTKTDTYEDSETTKTTTTTTTYQDYETTTKTRDNEHVATFDESEQDGFVLVYGKTTTDKSTSTETLGSQKSVDTQTRVTGRHDEVTKDTVTETQKRTEVVTTECPPEEFVDPDMGNGNAGDELDVSSYVRIPRHAEGISNLAQVTNDLADTTSTVLAAAARLEIDEENETDTEEE